MDNKIIDNIATLENLHWAWQKLKSAYASATDIWLNKIEIESFEGELEENLRIIQNELKEGRYSLHPIYPVAYPKMKDKENDEHRTRPAFYINVRDQLVWIAVLNIIGSTYDYKMPFWSFGHRLYITTWVEGNSGGNLGKLKYGWYRNTTRNFYRNWKQSWPKFRRHIFLTIKAMSGRLTSEASVDSLTEQELMELESNTEAKQFLKNKYLEQKYWPNTDDDLYWCTIDLKKFYPSIHKNEVLSNIVKFNKGIVKGDPTFHLISNLLDFKIATDSGWNSEEIREVFDDEKNPKIGLPTGLIVAGFLSNIAMLEIDNEIQKSLQKKDFACFRFVDDYVILAKDIQNLKIWYKKYQELITSKLKDVKIGVQKTEPEEFRKWISEEGSIDEEIVKSKCKLDPDNPTPLVTQTLLKLSLIAGQDINFLTDDESQKMINDLQHFLLTDFADHEIKKETQVSFALTMLSKLIPELKTDYSKVHRLRREKNLFIHKSDEEIAKLKCKFIDEHGDTPKSQVELSVVQALVSKKKERVADFDTKIEKEKKKADKKYNHQVQKFFLFFKTTVIDNYAKPKLWLRLIEYCSRVGYEDIKSIFNGIDSLKKKNELNDLNYASLNILCATIINGISLKIIKSYLGHNKFIDKRRENFLRSIFTNQNIGLILSQLVGDKYDAVITRKEFLVVLRVVTDVLKTDFDKSILSEADKSTFLLTSSNKNELIFMIYRKISSFITPNGYWLELSKETNRDKPLAKIISILSRNPELANSEEIDYRVVNTLREIQILDETPKTLQNYLFECQEYPDNNLFFSEYAALLLIHELVQSVNDEYHSLGKNIPLEKLNFHPGCFVFTDYPETNLNSWDDLNFFFHKNLNTLFQFNNNQLLPDKRYVPDKITEYNDTNIAEVYALGVLLWQMTYKQPTLPNELFIDNGRFFINLTNHNDVKYFPSAYSDFIIRSCLSPISRESNKWIDKRIILKGFKYSLTSENEHKGFPPSILDIFELERRIGRAKELLQKDQLNITNNVGRQMVYLSFKNPTALNDILK